MTEKVVQIIKDRIKTQEEQIDQLTGFDRLDLNDAKARKEELEELLEEIQND